MDEPREALDLLKKISVQDNKPKRRYNRKKKV